jgi:hypothetical protein
MSLIQSASRSKAIRLIESSVVLSAILGCTDVVLPRSDLNIPSGGATGTPVATLTAISVSLSTSTAQVGQTAKATAAGTDQFGRQFAPGVVTWTTTPDGLATVTEDGTVTAVSEGVVTVVASKAGVPPGSASLTISR